MLGKISYRDRAADIIRCPITAANLRILDRIETRNINSKIDRKEVFYYDGSPVQKKIVSGYITNDGEYVYRKIKGITLLTPEEALIVGREKKLIITQSHGDKKTVIDFYNQVGWKKGGGGGFNDAQKYEDLRPVVRDYIHKCHLRINQFLKPSGQYLLDAGSGPIQYKEYLSYSKRFDYRVCVDISLLALKEAKKRLGKKGIYILADLTNLPFKDNTFDGAVSLHVIYHIPKREQKKALKEIFRTLNPNSSAAIVYSWPSNFNFMEIAGKIARKLGLLKSIPSKPDFYFQPQNYQFLSHRLGFPLEVKVWRSLGVDFTRKYIHQWLLGRQILRIVYWLEDTFPSLAGRIGRYPLLIIKK